MRFRLFSKIEFEIDYPVALIECFCIQTDFYASYDLLLLDRKVKEVNKIGARIAKERLPEDKELADITENVPIFKYDLDDFLKLDNGIIKNHVTKASIVIQQLMARSIGFSQATKVLHTVYPKIFPMIDSMLREEYRLNVNLGWQDDPEPILFAYYRNLKEEPTKQNLATLFDTVSRNLPCLTKVRVFDIIWWSYLRAKKLRDQNHVNWCTIT